MLSYKTLVLVYTLGTSFLLPSCTEPQHSPNEQQEVAKNSTGGRTSPTVRRVSVDSTIYVFNVPALVNLTADQITAQLGKPVRDEQESINAEMKTLLYQRQGYELSIDYEVESRRLLSIYFAPTKSWQAYPQLLRAANVTIKDGKGYKVEPLNEEGGLYEGIAFRLDSARVMDEYGKWVLRR